MVWLSHKTLACASKILEEQSSRKSRCSNVLACELIVENAAEYPNPDSVANRWAHQGTNFSLVAFGNSMKCPDRVLPEWVSPLERDGAFWRSGTEGLSLLLNVMASISLLMVIVAAKFRSELLLSVLSRWQTGHTSHPQWTSASAWLPSHMAHQVLLRVFIFIFLLSWDSYKCPPALSMASVCLRDGTFNYLLVIVLWSQNHLSFNKLGYRTPNGRSVNRESSTRMPIILGLLSLPLALVLSSVCVLNQAMKSVPAFLGISGFWSTVLNSSVGAIQGFLGGLVVPSLVHRISATAIAVAMAILRCQWRHHCVVTLGVKISLFCRGN